MEIVELRDSNDLLSRPEAMRKRMRDDGYLLFRGLIPRAEVLAVRAAVLGPCEKSGWIKAGTVLDEAVTSHAPVAEGTKEWEPAYEAIQKLESFHRLPHHPAMESLMKDLFEEPVFCLPNKICRIAFPNDNAKATPAHQDFLYIQGSTETITAWMPLGDVPAALGGLMVQPGSHKSGFYLPFKHPGVGGNAVAYDPTLPWAGTDYRAGDVLLFHSLTVHAARPSQSRDRIRFSMDFRYVGLSHSVSEENLAPHWHWLGGPFNWDNLDKGWDAGLRRYWEKVPLKLTKHQPRLFASE